MNTAATHSAPEDVMAFLDGELSAEQAQPVNQHLEHCPECASRAATFRSSSNSLADWRVQPIPQRLADGILENAKNIRSGGPVSGPNIFVRVSLWNWKQWAVGVVVASVLLSFGVLTGNYTRKQHELEGWMGKRPVSVDSASVNRPESHMDMAFPSASTRSTQSEAVAGGGAGEAAPTYQPQAPMIARSASLTLVIKDFAGARAALDAILVRHHAYASDLKASTVENAPRTLVAFLRVPAQDLGPTLAELKSLGRLQEETQNAEEVTQQHADLVARLKNSRETEQRLQAILAQRTGKMSDVLEVEQEIARVRGEIEAMEAEQKTLEHRVEYASVNLILTEVYQAQLAVPPISASSRLHNAMINGYRNASETILGIILFFAEYGLTLIIWLAILAIPVWFLRRRYRRSLASI